MMLAEFATRTCWLLAPLCTEPAPECPAPHATPLRRVPVLALPELSAAVVPVFSSKVHRPIWSAGLQLVAVAA